MRLLIVGLGVQGRKRLAAAGASVVATVDPAMPEASYGTLRDVPLEVFDAACVCTPDQVKLDLVRYLLAHGKHVLIEKPLLAEDPEMIRGLADLARSAGAACYTAYNHRFEPHVARLKDVLASGTLGRLFHARLCYGNGTARDVRSSLWRDQGLGVLSDLGSHLLDLACFLFGRPAGPFEAWGLHRFENRACDHVVFGTMSDAPAVACEASLVCWRNTFTIDVFGERGSAHVEGLCKWGGSTFTVRRRVFPSGRPEERVETATGPDPTWTLEQAHFERVCQARQADLEPDAWISDTLHELAAQAAVQT